MASRCRDLLRLNRPIVSCLTPARRFGLVPRRDFAFRRGDDFFNNVFYDLNRTARAMEKVVDNITRNGFAGVYSNLSPVRAYELPIIVNEDGTRLYRLRFDLEGFAPENIKLTIKDHVLCVQAKQGEERTGDQKLKLYKDLRFEYKLPKEINIEQITSKQNSDGTLTIEAPLPKLEKNDESVEIPIERG